MTTLQDMRDEIKSDLVISGADYDTQIDNKIRSAIRQYRGSRFWFLLANGTRTLLAGTSSVSLPSSFAAPRTFDLIYAGTRLYDGNGFDFLSYSRLTETYWMTSPLFTGVPRACAISGSTLHMSSLADADYTINFTYYKTDSPLPSGDSGTSAWFDEGYDAIRSMAQFLFKRDAGGFAATEEDGAMATFHMEQLRQAHIAHEAGRG